MMMMTKKQYVAERDRVLDFVKSEIDRREWAKIASPGTVDDIVRCFMDDMRWAGTANRPKRSLAILVDEFLWNKVRSNRAIYFWLGEDGELKSLGVENINEVDYPSDELIPRFFALGLE